MLKFGMVESEVLYTARQVTEALDCSPQMAGKYFQAFEKITNKKIKTHGRDGRQFDGPTRAVLLEAREIVRSDSAATVEGAVRRALSLSQVPVETEVWGSGTEIDLERLKALLSEAITEPLRDDLQDIKAELASLQAKSQELREKRQIAPSAQQEETQHGAFATFAIWVEKLMRT